MARALGRKKRVRLPFGSEDEIVALYCSGSSTTQIGHKFGTTTGAIYRVLKSKGVSSRRRYVSLPNGVEDEVVKLYVSGWSAYRISRRYGTTFQPVYRILKKHGVDRRYKGGPSKLIPAVKQIALGTFAAGATGREAAAAAGISDSSMSELLKREGIKSRRKVRKFSEAEELEIIKRYKAGEAGADIGADYGVFHKRIYAILRSRGVSTRPPPRHPWTDRKGRKLVFRSRWELEVARYLDDYDCEWFYEEVMYRLVDGERKRRYTPDFWVYESKDLVAIIEVKGRWFGDQRHRINLFTEQYPHRPFMIWDAGVLRKLGILDRITYTLKAT